MALTVGLPRVMFLHHPNDETWVNQIIQVLQAEDVLPWAHHTHILFGENVIQELGEALESYTHVVIFVTPQFVGDGLNMLAVRDILARRRALILLQLLHSESTPLPFMHSFRPIDRADQRPPSEIAAAIRRTLEGIPLVIGCEAQLEELPVTGPLAEGLRIIFVRMAQGTLHTRSFRQLLRRIRRQNTPPVLPILLVVTHGAFSAPFEEVRLLLCDECPSNTTVMASFEEVPWPFMSGYPHREPAGEHSGSCAATATWARGELGAPIYEHVRSHLGQTPDLGEGSLQSPSQPCFRTVDGIVIGLVGITVGEIVAGGTTQLLAGAYASALTALGVAPDLTVVFTGGSAQLNTAKDRLLRSTNGNDPSKFVASPLLGIIGRGPSPCTFQIPEDESVAYCVHWNPIGLDAESASRHYITTKGLGAVEPLRPWGTLYQGAIRRDDILPAYPEETRKLLRFKRVRIRRRLLVSLSEGRREGLLRLLDPTIQDPMTHFSQPPGRKKIRGLWQVLAKAELAGRLELAAERSYSAQWENGHGIVALAGAEGSSVHSVVEDYCSRVIQNRGDEDLNPFTTVFVVVLDGLGPNRIADFTPSGISELPKEGQPSQIRYCRLSTLEGEVYQALCRRDVQILFGRGT